ncbi:putative L-amino-acid oxidase YobN [Mytilus trossulus]|uniref:putative L-amino-acid oxidase YobN n=1 Tax=Mytilus trossulus TaxID=6551 RepID=UPI0030078FB4
MEAKRQLSARTKLDDAISLDRSINYESHEEDDELFNLKQSLKITDENLRKQRMENEKRKLQDELQRKQTELEKEKDRHFVNTAHPTFSCPYIGSLTLEQMQSPVSTEGKYITPPPEPAPVQQDDCGKEFYMNIINGSLRSTFEKYGPSICTGSGNTTGAKSVVIVGAGVSGLSAAFELEKVGYHTQIVELQHRVGGRTKTLKAGFSDGLHAEGGAMRIPKNHYCTNGYIKKFDIDLRNFQNYNAYTWLYLDGIGKIRTKDWENNNKYYSDKFYLGWDANIPAYQRDKVDGILHLYSLTVNPVKADLFAMIDSNGHHTGWNKWVEKWSKLSVNDFLRSRIGAEPSCIYRPWPEIAIRGYQIGSYSPAFNTSLVEFLRDDLGKWWTHLLKTPVDGMDTIAKHFIKPHTFELKTIDLSRNISYGVRINKIRKINRNKVEVIGKNVVTGEDILFLADAVIVTVPLNILRQIDIDLDEEYRRAISYIHYQPSTKVALQCRTRFWEKEVGQGGFTKTNLPIGQLHYPSRDDPLLPNERGILVSYTWEQDALIFGSQTKREAIESAVREVSKIHPEMSKQFEVGMVQAWFSDDAAQGAYACLLPFQYNEGMKTLMTPDHPIYLAGEAMSYTNGWIQGAIESGLNAAYHLYSNNNFRRMCPE